MKILALTRILQANMIYGIFLTLIVNTSSAQKVLRVAVAGMAHDHVHGILSQYKKGEVSDCRNCRRR